MDVVTIGKNLRRYRKTRRLSLKQLGDKIGASFTAIARWERGERNSIPIGKLFALCAALKIEPYQLFLDPDQVVQLSREEQKLIADYRQLKNPKIRESINSLINNLI